MSKGDLKPVVTIYDTETEYVTRKGFEKLMRRVKALEQALNARDEARGAAELIPCAEFCGGEEYSYRGCEGHCPECAWSVNQKKGHARGCTRAATTEPAPEIPPARVHIPNPPPGWACTCRECAGQKAGQVADGADSSPALNKNPRGGTST